MKCQGLDYHGCDGIAFVVAITKYGKQEHEKDEFYLCQKCFKIMERDCKKDNWFYHFSSRSLTDIEKETSPEDKENINILSHSIKNNKANETNVALPVKRKRGRPRKNPI